MNQSTFGADHTFDELAERIRGFSHDDASTTEQGKLITGLKMLAEETTVRWARVRKMELELKGRLDLADVYDQVEEVCTITRPGKRIGFWRRVWNKLPFGCGE